MKTVFVHPERCIGCKQCEVACAVAHSQTKNLFLAVFESPYSQAAHSCRAWDGAQLSLPQQMPALQPGSLPDGMPNSSHLPPTDHPEIVYLNPAKMHRLRYVCHRVPVRCDHILCLQYGTRSSSSGNQVRSLHRATAPRR